MTRVLGLVALLASAFLFFANSSRTARAEGSKAPVLVELFTSEGCSSCPPADKLLRDMQEGRFPEGVQVIAMGEHVDYWNQLGWKDRFSSAEFTARQSRYARNLKLESVYTPQVVVDGQYDVLGNDDSALQRAIAAAASKSKSAAIQITMTSPEKVHVSVTGAPDSRVELAITQDGLTTQVRSGENGGRELKHAAVVRTLYDLGKSKQGALEGEFPLKIGSDWDRQRLHIIVMAQQEDGKVLGVSALNP